MKCVVLLSIHVSMSMVYVLPRSDEEALRLIHMEAPQKKSSAPVIKEEGSIP